MHSRVIIQSLFFLTTGYKHAHTSVIVLSNNRLKNMHILNIHIPTNNVTQESQIILQYFAYNHHRNYNVATISKQNATVFPVWSVEFRVMFS